MFTVLNRLRGTKGYFSHITGLIIGSLFYIFTQDIYTSIGLTVMYVFGESFGWGKWIGGVYRNYHGSPTEVMLLDTEGRRNGIHYLTNLVYPEKENYYKYCYLALTLRGIYWVGLTLLPLVLSGYIDVATYFSITALLGWGFPLSVKLGTYTTKKFNYVSKYFGMNGFWEHAEVWYGAMMDIVLIYLLII